MEVATRASRLAGHAAHAAERPFARHIRVSSRLPKACTVSGSAPSHQLTRSKWWVDLCTEAAELCFCVPAAEVVGAVDGVERPVEVHGDDLADRALVEQLLDR